MSTDTVRSLKIKTGAVKRTTKEYKSYHTELQNEQRRLEKMRSDSADAYDIKQQENVVQESAVMITATKKALQEHLDELKNYMSSLGDDVPTDDEHRVQALEVEIAAEEALAA